MELSEKEFWDCKEQFYEQFNKLVDDFYVVKKAQFSKSTAQNYYLIAHAWIEYLYGYTPCINYEDITVAQTNSHFWAMTRHQQLYDFDSKEVKSKLKVFILFLKELGYENPNVDKAIAKK